MELVQSGNRVSGSYHVGLQQSEIDGRIEGEGRVGFSFAGMDEMEAVHGRGELRIEGAQAHFVLACHQPSADLLLNGEHRHRNAVIVTERLETPRHS